MSGWDYSLAGSYFITMLTHKRKCLFGSIENGCMTLSDFGLIVQEEWCKSFEIRKQLINDAFIVMPNHIHAIVIAENAEVKESLQPASLQDTLSGKCAGLKRQPRSISSFIAGYKSSVITKIDDWIDKENAMGASYKKYNRKNPLWHRNFHDHIVRIDEADYRIKEYILSNPQNWNSDEHRQ
jgi:REP element-mobilizing transposase RayT